MSKAETPVPPFNGVYPNCVITEDEIVFSETGNGPAAVIQTCDIEGEVKVKGDFGYHTRITFTVFVNDLTIQAGARFTGEPEGEL